MYYLAVTLLFAFVSASHQAGQTQIGSSCKAPEDCSNNAVCSEKSNICKCFYSYTPEPDKINCRPLSCATESDCITRYGDHSICSTGKTCHCDLDSGWTFDMETLNSCLPRMVLLNQTCKKETDCGTRAFCDLKADQPKCKCDLGFEPDLKSQINCLKINCKTDADCAQSDPHLQCNPSSLLPCGQCNYDSGYVKDSNIQRCVPRNQFIGKYCSKTSNFTCGTGALCDLENSSNSCRCWFGYIPKSNQMDCSEFHCTSDAQCEQLNPNSQCFRSESCICKVGYKLDWERQVCVYSSTNAAWTSNLHLIMFLIVMLLYNIL